MRRIFVITAVSVLLAGAVAFANDKYKMPNVITDTYQIDFGPMVEAFPGETDLYIPVWINSSQPVIGINILLQYDASLLSPSHIVPNMFFQSFVVDHSIPGIIRLNLYTDLPPPPQVPPIEGDTIFAWIGCTVTTEDLGYDLLTHFTFYDDPITPYPDNSILLESGDWVVPPALFLVQADILIISPLYGDINVNGFAFEIGDAITFLNYFMGQIEFTRRQYANSDCNRDGIQASIADLVYLLGIISGDTLLTAVGESPAIPYTIEGGENFENSRYKSGLDSRSVLTVDIDSRELLGGAYFSFAYDSEGTEIDAVLLNPAIDDLDLSWTAENGKLMVVVYNWNGTSSAFNKGELFSVYFSGNSGLYDSVLDVERVEFSDVWGNVADASYSMDLSYNKHLSLTPEKSGISISGYPNPFNASVTISYELPAEGNYDLVIFDILGREVKTLINGYKSSGGGAIVWDGTDNFQSEVSSGIYFARLRGETVSANIKLFMLK
jgi:hypothetical protein